MTNTTFNPKLAEKILVVDREELFGIKDDSFQGIRTEPEFIRLMERRFKNRFAVRRAAAEVNPDWKQLITYAVIRRHDEVFVYERLKGGNESRLHNQRSIGVGGHMNPCDHYEDWKMVLETNARKEISEELRITVPFEYRPRFEIQGIINDDVSEVGKVHLGLLMIIDLPIGSEVSVRETDKLAGYWAKFDDFKDENKFRELETWSQIAIYAINIMDK